MFCKKCGKEIPDNEKKCIYCGEDLLEVSENNLNSTTSNGYRPKKRKIVKIIAVIIVALGINMLIGKLEEESPEKGDGKPSHGDTITGIISVENSEENEISTEDIQNYLFLDSEVSPIKITDIHISSTYLGIAISWDIVNQSGINIREATFGITAWNEDKLPLILVPSWSVNDEYVLRITSDNISIDKEDVYSIEVDYDEEIEFLNVVLLEYEDFEGNTWNNPAAAYYEDMASKPLDEGSVAYSFDAPEQNE